MGLFNNQFANVIELVTSLVTMSSFGFGVTKKLSVGVASLFVQDKMLFSYIMEKLKESLKMKEIMKSSLKSFLFSTTLKGFKFGFNSPLRAEVLFVNTKEFLIRWGN